MRFRLNLPKVVPACSNISEEGTSFVSVFTAAESSVESIVGIDLPTVLLK